ncbi:MAG: UvrD-helicase domain-containing protein [Pirellulales bacterium]|nr:UvrD-helicase domain-containing protein [Pirellulales bacterium]
MASTLAAERPLTEQQRAALEARDRSVSLSAGAGCGKTFVLTERFLAHVDPTQAEAGGLEELVAITFTDAAAREMRDRIRRRCFERLQSAATPTEAAAWQRLMRSMDAARISTIHSFCTQLLRVHAVEAGLDPQFEVLDAAAAELLKLETVDDRLRSLLLAGQEEVLDLAAKRGLDRLRSDVAELAGPRSDAATERWIDASPAEVVARWKEFYEEVAPAAFEDLRQSSALVELRRLCDPTLAKSGHLATRLTELAAVIDCLATAQAASCGEQLAELLKQARVADIRGAKHWNNVDDYEPMRLACERVRELLKKCPLNEAPEFGLAAEEAARQGLALLRMVADVTESLKAAKARRNQLEFDDLLALAHRLLADPEHAAIRQQIGKTTRLLMVDEFQDTNPLQVSIIQAFCGEDWRERGLFTVGDFKQSIYRFNGAEPEVSTKLRKELAPEGRLSLTRNFRSQPAITDFVNAVFHDEFAEYEPLTPARPQATETPSVEFLWTPGDVDDEGALADADAELVATKKRRRAGATRDARVLEAQWIARRLVQLLRSRERIVVGKDGAPRPLEPGDIAILLRTLSDAQVYEEAFREYGLEYYLAGGHAFYSQQEIYDILNLLRAVASTVDEIALAGVLRSPIFSLTDETLFWLVEKHKSLNAALAAERPPANLSAEEAAKVRRATATMARLRMEKDRLLIADLFALALELTGYDAVLLTEFLGPRKAANIEKLLEQARTLDRSSPGDLQGFITQLSEFVVRAPKEALAATQAEGNVIRIMTIHYAKGLEFPLVVLPDLDRQRNVGGSQPVLDARLGPLIPVEAEEEGGGCIGLDLYRHVEMREDLEERKRLLYVACTRAADSLLLSSSIDDPDKPKRDWLQLVDRHVSLADGTLREPLPAGYAAPHIRVITERPRIDDEAASVSRGADLNRLVTKTRELIAKSPGELPRECDAIGADGWARKRFSFSQLNGRLAVEEVESFFSPGDEDLEEWAEFLEPADRASDVDGRELGALVHAVLERMDVRRQEGVPELCEYLAPRYTEGDPVTLAAEAAAMIEPFLHSPRAAELAAATVVRREVEFLLPWPIDAADGEGRYLHGYIDCLYQGADGRWRLLDYKTNRATIENAGAVARSYESQLLVYALACEQALGEPLAECTLVLLDPGTEHAFAWDAAARRKSAARLTAAMQSLMNEQS